MVHWKRPTYDFHFELIKKIIILFSILKYVTDISVFWIFSWDIYSEGH